MEQDTDSPDRADGTPVDESDDSMFTDSFAPRLDDPDAAEPDDELEEVEEALPQGGPVEGPAPLP